MMWLTKPAPDDIERLAHQLQMLPLSYEAGLLQRVDDESELPRHLRGWFVDRFEAEIGHGANDFAAARDALRGWQQFDRDWLVVADDPAPIQEDAVVTYRPARTAPVSTDISQGHAPSGGSRSHTSEITTRHRCHDRPSGT